MLGLSCDAASTPAPGGRGRNSAPVRSHRCGTRDTGVGAFFPHRWTGQAAARNPFLHGLLAGGSRGKAAACPTVGSAHARALGLQQGGGHCGRHCSHCTPTAASAQIRSWVPEPCARQKQTLGNTGVPGTAVLWGYESRLSVGFPSKLSVYTGLRWFY